jgi:hypothetical protein
MLVKFSSRESADYWAADLGKRLHVAGRLAGRRFALGLPPTLQPSVDVGSAIAGPSTCPEHRRPAGFPAPSADRADRHLEQVGEFALGQELIHTLECE